MAADARHILAVTEAVRVVINDAVAGRCPTEVAVSRAVAAVLVGPDEAPPAERPAARHRRQNALALAMMGELEHQGRGRSAAAIVAKRMAQNPHDPAEVWTLAQRFRRLRRGRKSARRAFGEL